VSAQVVFSERAGKQVDAADLWWRANRPAAPDLFAEELGDASLLLAEVPDIGQPFLGARRYRNVRRLLLRRTQHHVYYVHDDPPTVVQVIAVWPTRRRKPPAM
jgi:plasmid stabilization system protein ParE